MSKIISSKYKLTIAQKRFKMIPRNESEDFRSLPKHTLKMKCKRNMMGVFPATVREASFCCRREHTKRPTARHYADRGSVVGGVIHPSQIIIHDTLWRIHEWLTVPGSGWHVPSLWENQYSFTMKMFDIIRNQCPYAYLYFNRPGEVADIHIKCDVRIASEVEFFIGKAISVFLYICLRNYRSLFPRYCSS